MPASTIALPRSMRLMVPVNEVLLAIEEVVQNLLALGVADLLQNDLLGGLRTDTTEVDRLQRLFDVVATLDLRIILLRFGKRHLRGIR